MIYFQKFRKDGTANTTEYDDGLKSTAENPKRLLSVLVQVEELPVEDAELQIWYEQEKITEIPIEMFSSPAQVTPNPYGINLLNEVEVGFDIPVGATVKVAIKSGATANNILGAYRYEITT